MSVTARDLVNHATPEQRLLKIEELISARLCLRLGVDVVPDELDYIVTEASISRFNRIGSEGLSSHSVEGETQSWTVDDLAPFESDIQRWLSRQKHGEGRIRFI